MPILNPVELQTRRLTLRWMNEDDAEACYAVRSDPQVARYLSRGPWTELAQARQAIEQTLANYASGAGLRLGIVLRDSGRLIGDACLYDFVDDSRRCDVGYVLGRAHWGQGYVSEALEALLGYGFDTLGLNRVEADIDPANAASGRVLEKLGFRREGYMPERWIVNGVPADTVFYGLLRRHWQERRAAAPR
ncbi:MAG TPA: GNAT family N-acetyltransferase [Telluria sp.]|jgi:RimJ/RimL family protein N-acetyltransferase